MKKYLLLTALLVSGLLLSACGRANRSAGAFTLTPETKLALGIMKLEGTPQAVDKQTAAKLLPLWQLLEQLNGSSSAAPEEISAVIDEIQATMTPEQSQAIAAMQFGQQDVLAAFQQARSSGSAGGATGGSRTGGNGGGNRGNGGGQAFFFGGGGGLPGGGFPGGGTFGGGARPGSGTATASQNGSSTGSAQSFSNRSAGFLVGEVVRLLQSKIGA